MNQKIEEWKHRLPYFEQYFCAMEKSYFLLGRSDLWALLLTQSQMGCFGDPVSVFFVLKIIYRWPQPLGILDFEVAATLSLSHSLSLSLSLSPFAKVHYESCLISFFYPHA